MQFVLRCVQMPPCRELSVQRHFRCAENVEQAENQEVWCFGENFSTTLCCSDLKILAGFKKFGILTKMRGWFK